MTKNHEISLSSKFLAHLDGLSIEWVETVDKG